MQISVSATATGSAWVAGKVWRLGKNRVGFLSEFSVNGHYRCSGVRSACERRHTE